MNQIDKPYVIWIPQFVYESDFHLSFNDGIMRLLMSLTFFFTF